MENKSSNAKWYFTHSDSDDSEKYYDIFFDVCHKYGVSYASATEKQRWFVEAVTDYYFKVLKAEKEGKSKEGITLFDMRIAD